MAKTDLAAAIAAQLMFLAQGDDQLGRGEYDCLEVTEDGPRSFEIIACLPGEELRTFKIHVEER